MTMKAASCFVPSDDEEQAQVAAEAESLVARLIRLVQPPDLWIAVVAVGVDVAFVTGRQYRATSRARK